MPPSARPWSRGCIKATKVFILLVLHFNKWYRGTFMRKTWLLFPLVGLILILASGSLCGCSMRKSFLMMDDESIANKQFEKLIDAIQTQDIDAVRALFSENALKEAENADESIQAMFDYFHGTMASYNDWAGPNVIAGNNDDGTGRYWKRYYSTYDIETTQDKYRLAMETITADTTDAGNVGIRSLYIIRFEDDTDQDCAYRRRCLYTRYQYRKSTRKCRVLTEVP